MDAAQPLPRAHLFDTPEAKMVNMYQLWMPIVLSSVLVFFMSSLIWMALKYHKNDITGLPDEPSIVDALRKQKLAPGQYAFPWHADMAAMKSPEFQKKMAEGPVGMITIRPPGNAGMGPMLGKWFIYLLVISSVVAYVTGRTLTAGVSYLVVFRVAGTVAFLGYGGAHAIYAIFWGRPWSVVWRDIFDSLLYGCLTAGAFGWLWPR
jgi:hypothetical protein